MLGFILMGYDNILVCFKLFFYKFDPRQSFVAKWHLLFQLLHFIIEVFIEERRGRRFLIYFCHFFGVYQANIWNGWKLIWASLTELRPWRFCLDERVFWIIVSEAFASRLKGLVELYNPDFYVVFELVVSLWVVVPKYSFILLLCLPILAKVYSYLSFTINLSQRFDLDASLFDKPKQLIIFEAEIVHLALPDDFFHYSVDSAEDSFQDDLRVL